MTPGNNPETFIHNNNHGESLQSHKYLEIFEMWCWRIMEKISGTDRRREEEVLHRVKEDRNIIHTVKRRVNWICHILNRNTLLKER
jgi:hypothetical protein